MRLQAPHCPACGAPVDVPDGATKVSCAYCQTSLVVEAHAVSTRGHGHRQASQPAPPSPEPDATLRNWEVGRFEISLIEQPIDGAPRDVFAGFELPGGSFAFVSMRLVDEAGAPIDGSLEAAFVALRGSLEHDKDPGLAANLALEALCASPFSARLELVVALFEPSRMRVTPYSAGAREALAWASSEEGRVVVLSGHGQPLSRKSLKERGDQFENGAALHLASTDLILFPSPGFLGRGARSSGNGLRQLLEVANEHLGEAPLRVVTLAKNAFWEDFQRASSSRPAPVGDVKLAAVRAVLPETQGRSLDGALETLRTTRYEVALLRRPNERVEVMALHDERHALLWAGGLTEEQFAHARAAVLETLDRRDHGDNDNPRRAGREAQARSGAAGPMLVAHLSDRHRRIKWWRTGWKQPIQLGPRGVKGDGHQAFDEGGEATVAEGHRLFFPGTLPFEGVAQRADELALLWPGGKASRLFDALVAHWKTKRSAPALEALSLAAASDVSAPLEGLALFTGLP